MDKQMVKGQFKRTIVVVFVSHPVSVFSLLEIRYGVSSCRTLQFALKRVLVLVPRTL